MFFLSFHHYVYTIFHYSLAIVLVDVVMCCFCAPSHSNDLGHIVLSLSTNLNPTCNFQTIYYILFIFGMHYSLGQVLADDTSVYAFMTLTLYDLGWPCWGRVFCKHITSFVSGNIAWACIISAIFFFFLLLMHLKTSHAWW